MVQRATQRAEEIVDRYEQAVAEPVREAIARWTEEQLHAGTPAG